MSSSVGFYAVRSQRATDAVDVYQCESDDSSADPQYVLDPDFWISSVMWDNDVVPSVWILIHQNEIEVVSRMCDK